MSRAEITTPESLTDESVVELSLRPQRLAEFIGQQKVKDSLRIYIDAAIVRREPLDHTLFFGPPRLGMLTAPMHARFGIEQRLNFYPAEDLELIVHRTADVMKVEIAADGASEIARRARGTPRVANRLLRRVRDYAQVKGNGVITK